MKVIYWLRGLRAWWLEPRIILPTQATLADYLAIIREVLPTIATEADAVMRTALTGRVQRAAPPVDEPSLSGVDSGASLVPPRPSRRRPATVARSDRPSPTANRRDFARDFEGTPALPVAMVRHQDWAADFADEGAGAGAVAQPGGVDTDALALGTESSSAPRAFPDFSADFAGGQPEAAEATAVVNRTPRQRPGASGDGETRPRISDRDA